MSEPEEIRFACIGCGALNPAGAGVCSGCGHRFAGPDIVPTPAPDRAPIVPPVRRPLSPERYYEPPQAPIAPPSTFRIGTAMVFIAVIAVCLAAFAADTLWGVVVSLFLLPASIRTFLVSARCESAGGPMTLREQFITFLETICYVVLVVVSSAVAFCGTCVPIGMISMGNGIGLVVALVVGVVAAIGAGFLVARGLLRIARSNERERNEIRWQ